MPNPRLKPGAFKFDAFSIFSEFETRTQPLLAGSNTGTFATGFIPLEPYYSNEKEHWIKMPTGTSALQGLSPASLPPVPRPDLLTFSAAGMGYFLQGDAIHGTHFDAGTATDALVLIEVKVIVIGVI